MISFIGDKSFRANGWFGAASGAVWFSDELDVAQGIQPQPEVTIQPVIPTSISSGGGGSSLTWACDFYDTPHFRRCLEEMEIPDPLPPLPLPAAYDLIPSPAQQFLGLADSVLLPNAQWMGALAGVALGAVFAKGKSRPWVIVGAGVLGWAFGAWWQSRRSDG